MATGTIIMIVCAVLLGLFGFLFIEKVSGEKDEKYYACDDPDFDGPDGAGVLGLFSDELDTKHNI